MSTARVVGVPLVVAVDLRPGKRAGVKTCAVRYGYGKHDEIARFQPDYWIDDLRGLLNGPLLDSHRDARLTSA